MSRYISSYLIDPVVRHARRFSRPDALESSSPEADSISVPARSQLQEALDVLEENEDDSLEHLPHSPLPDDNLSFSRAASLRELTQENPDSLGHHNGHEAAWRGQVQRTPFARARTTSNSQPQWRRSISDQYVSTTTSFPDLINGAPSAYPEEPGRSGRNSFTNGTLSPRNSVVESEIPEDDGMGSLRKRILEIQGLEVPADEKSRLLHALMMESYSSSPRSKNLRPQSPSSCKSHDRPCTPVSGQSNDYLLTDSPNTTFSTEDDLCVTVEEREPTYYFASEAKKNLDANEDERQFGCVHYKRNVKLQCSTCRRWYTCRFCHDQNEDHCLNRRATKNMLCMVCGYPQPASQECYSCGQLAAWYFCKICKFWDDDATKSIYHCNDCGICRRGEGLGKDYFHCKVSNLVTTTLSLANGEEMFCLHLYAGQGYPQMH